VTIAFVLGYLLYSKLVAVKINLRESLFVKDNIAAWLEFIGAFVFPVLYLSAGAIEGSADGNLWVDLAICAAYAALYVLAFTALRLLSGLIVSLLGKSDEEGRIDLNNEIYVQSNTAASLFSVSLSIVFVSLIGFLDLTSGFLLASVLRILVIAVFTLASAAVYCLVLRRKTTLFKEIFIDNNTAAGISFAGFIFAVEILLSNAASLQTGFNLADLVFVSAIWLVLLGILSYLFTSLLTRLLKANIWDEIYSQNNIGAAIGQCALFSGTALILVNFIK